MQRIFDWFGVHDLLFGTALFLYAVFSSPTPDIFGAAELSILVLLFLSLRPDFSRDNFPGVALAGYGLSIPLIIALISGYPVREIMRDVIPFLFLLLPVLYAGQAREKNYRLMMVMIAVGLIFSFRSLYSFGADIFTPEDWLGTPPDLLYLANSPEVLFAAVALLCMAWQADKPAMVRLSCFLISCLPLLAMATLMQRASLFYEASVVICLLATTFWRNTRAALGMTAIVLSVLFMASSFLDNILNQLSFKTQMVGLNSRGAEWQAVFNQISQSPVNSLFGMGWGAEFENPAVGNLRVSFTHSLLSSLFLKTGLAGVIIFLIYGFNLLKSALPVLRRETIYLYALAGPLLIGLCLYASYKSLGYGLLLLILSACACGKRLEEEQEPVS